MIDGNHVKHRMAFCIKPQSRHWKGRSWSAFKPQQVFIEVLRLLELVGNDSEVVHSKNHAVPVVIRKGFSGLPRGWFKPPEKAWLALAAL